LCLDSLAILNKKKKIILEYLMSHFCRITEMNWEMKVNGREGQRAERARELQPEPGCR